MQDSSGPPATLDRERLLALVARHGTPLYVYDAAIVRARITAIRAAFAPRPPTILYSAKANPAVGMVAWMHGHGLGLDACSPGDLRLAELAGVARAAISYTGFGSADAELLHAAAASGDLVLDDAGELDRLAALGARRPIGLRVNPGIEAGFHTHVAAGAATAKFGIPSAGVGAVAARAGELGLPVVGLHAHLGSDVLDAGPHTQLLRLLARLAGELGPAVRWINLGGGWGTPRRASEASFPWDTVGRAAREILTGPLADVELRIEPGGHLTMDAGWLVGRVVAIKGADAQRATTIVTDAGTNHLPSVLLYSAHHPTAIVSSAPERHDNPVRTYRIAGNLMQAADVLADDVVAGDVYPGDLVAFGHAGAYAASRATTFNERPRPAEVLVDGDRTMVLRRAETLDDLFARDHPAVPCRPPRE